MNTTPPRDAAQKLRDDMNDLAKENEDLKAEQSARHERIEKLKEKLADDREANAALGLTKIPCAVNEDGMLFIKHGDGQWVSAAKLSAFSMDILRAAGSI